MYHAYLAVHAHNGYNANTMWQFLLSIVFPPHHNERTLATLTSLTPQSYNVTTARGTNVLTCARYDEPHVHCAVQLLKKHGNEHAVLLLAQLLNDTLLEELARDQIWDPKDIVLIPLPLSKKRSRERGFNQVEKVCEALPTQLRQHIDTAILTRTVHTKLQKTLSRPERFLNVAGVFSVSNPEKVQGKRVILIDDVLTTGATLDEAAHVLRQAGAEVAAVALARA